MKSFSIPQPLNQGNIGRTQMLMGLFADQEIPQLQNQGVVSDKLKNKGNLRNGTVVDLSMRLRRSPYAGATVT